MYIRLKILSLVMCSLDMFKDPCTIALEHDKQLMAIHTQDNIIDRDELQANYINRILDGMDIKDMMAILYDQFDDNLDKYSVDELIEEVNEYYPDLLD